MLLQESAPAVVCFSGGMDSSFLLWACTIFLPAGQVTAFTFDSATYSVEEKARAITTADYLSVKHVILQSPEMENPYFIRNDLLRCYYCKRERFTYLRRYLDENKFSCTLLEGSQTDDLRDYRPGMQAVKELSIRSPLLEAGISRADIELVCKQRQLPFRNYKTESCLATRIKTGQPIDITLLKRIEKAEAYIKQLGFELVRARSDNNQVSIEVEPALVANLVSCRTSVEQYILSLGFASMQISPEGYQSSINTHEGEVHG